MHQNRGCDQPNDSNHNHQEPANVLSGMAQHADEVPSIVKGDEADHGVPYAPANRNHQKKFSHRILQYPSGREKRAGGNGKGTAAETANPPVPQRSMYSRKVATRRFPNFFCR